MPKSLPLLDTSAPVCCPPLTSGVMDVQDALAVALRLKALADPVRMRLMSMVIEAADAGLCICEMAPALGLSEPTVSHHCRQLRAAGLLEGTKRGTNVFYRPQRDALCALVKVLDPTCC